MKLTEAQEKWLQALESGQYKQGKDVLRDDEDCFCCLGVACDLFIPETVDQGGYGYWYGEGADCEDSVAPKSVVEKLHLLSQNGKIAGRDEYEPNSCLAQLNDNGQTFKQIAAFIRENPEKIFTKGAE